MTELNDDLDAWFAEVEHETNIDRDRTRNTIVPRSDSFPRLVHHFANPDLVMEVRWYGLESTAHGAVPVVATADGAWYAGEAEIEDGKPVLSAVNAYADEGTALTYIRDRNRVWTL